MQLLLLLFTFGRGSKRVVKTDKFPLAQRGLSVEMDWRSPPRRRRHQIPTHKRERGGVAELHKNLFPLSAFSPGASSRRCAARVESELEQDQPQNCLSLPAPSLAFTSAVTCVGKSCQRSAYHEAKTSVMYSATSVCNTKHSSHMEECRTSADNGPIGALSNVSCCERGLRECHRDLQSFGVSFQPIT